LPTSVLAAYYAASVRAYLTIPSEGGLLMATYISLLRFTPQGIADIKDSPTRLEAAKKLFQSMGAQLKEFYLVTGQYDAVVVSEGPDDETAAAMVLKIGSLGAVRTETMRAFPENEYKKIIAAIP
jgi:uncharacterized protein with GYD domain